MILGFFQNLFDINYERNNMIKFSSEKTRKLNIIHTFFVFFAFITAIYFIVIVDFLGGLFAFWIFDFR
jgi:hypothetical protein